MDIGSILGMVSGVTNFAIGGYQFVKGNKMEKSLGDQPEYEIPEEVFTNVSLADQIAFEGMPAAQRNAYVRDIQRSRAAAVRRAGSLSAGISGLAAAQVAEADSLSQIAANDAMLRIQNRKGQIAARGYLAQYKDQDYAEEKEQWLRKWKTSQALKGAGLQNMVSGLAGTASSAGSADWTSGNQRDEQVPMQSATPDAATIAVKSASAQNAAQNNAYTPENKLYSQLGFPQNSAATNIVNSYNTPSYNSQTGFQ